MEEKCLYNIQNGAQVEEKITLCIIYYGLGGVKVEED